MLVWIIGFSILGSIGAMIGAGALLLFPDRTRTMLIPCFLSYATGTLLGAALLGMIPKALAHAPSASVMATVLGGIVAFFVLEKLVLWRHCHDEDCDRHSHAGPLILIGDAFHNFVDGIVIAAAFLISVPLGITASIAVIAHEVPQEVGDIAILLNSGYSRTRAFAYNIASSLSTLPGALIAYYSLGTAQDAVPYILAASAASFIYVAVADLVPTLHRHIGFKETLRQLFLLLVGIGTIMAFQLGK